MKKIIFITLCIFILLSAFTACSNKEMEALPAEDGIASNGDNISAKETEDIDLSALECGEGGYFNITESGTYRLFSEGNVGVCIQVAKTEDVHLILDGADIINESGAAIYAASCGNLRVTLKDGTENYLSDGYSYAVGSGVEPNACLFSKCDLAIDGSGSLTVNGRCNNGIGTKSDLQIMSGKISVTASNNAIKGNDSVTVIGGQIDIVGCKDGIKSDSSDTGGKVSILGGEISMVCADDGIQCMDAVLKNCLVNITAGDEKLNCDGVSDIEDGCLS